MCIIPPFWRRHDGVVHVSDFFDNTTKSLIRIRSVFVDLWKERQSRAAVEWGCYGVTRD